ncbi:hypothetical protein ACFLXD_04510 [Chloroflexota bacterium]
MLKTWKPTMAGILNVISGVFFIIGGIIVVSLLGEPKVAMPWASYAMYSMGFEGEPGSPFTTTIIIILGTTIVILGLVSTLGGICAMKRKLWGMALAGSVSTFLTTFFLGIPTIALTAISKKEFV